MLQHQFLLILKTIEIVYEIGIMFCRNVVGRMGGGGIKGIELMI